MRVRTWIYRVGMAVIVAVVLLPGLAGAKDVLGELISPGELNRVHASLDGLANCTACHELGGGIPDQRCLACHETLADRIRLDLGWHAQAEGRCIDCHSDHRGRAFSIVELDVRSFDHDETGYVLGVAHDKLVCGRCHTRDVARDLDRTRTYLGLDGQCVACHADPHDGQFRDARGKVESCESCHQPTRWQQASEEVDHDATRFPLTGGHLAIACKDCHSQASFRGLATDCASCHEDTHQGQFRDASGRLEDCATCHQSSDWRETRVDHDRTRFPLTGRHDRVACLDCHSDGAFRGLGTDCASCHTDPHDGQFREPDGRVTACASCHDTLDWAKTQVDHDATRFPLTGAHRPVACETCHVDGRFEGVGTDCASCHEDTHEGQFLDAFGFVQACGHCHDTLDWKPARIDHEATRFPLTGAHHIVECAKCHEAGRFKPLDLACVSCHADPHDGQFVSAVGEPNACSDCHSSVDWKQTEFDHEQSRFPLTGEHRAIECATCHVDGRFHIATDCASCHVDPHDGGEGRECAVCHSTSTWKTLDATAHEDFFPLTGMHAVTSCDSCHLYEGGFQARVPDWGDPVACISCHVEPHLGQFGPTCADCHRPSGWLPLAFHHDDTAFPLRSAHKAVECGSCHRSRLYRDTPSQCFFCHEKDFASATSLDHRASVLVDCESCHRETAWVPARFEHSFFALSGGHRGLDCEQCHSGGIGPVPDDCQFCHAQDFQSAPRHQQLGLPPGDCEICHTSRAFGRHESSLPVDCFTCHRSEYVSPATRPNHLVEGFSTLCEDCHSTQVWEPARNAQRARKRRR